MKKFLIFLMVLSFMILISLPLSAGNKPMVEKRIDELNRFSREAISQIGAKPENGKINIKVRAVPAKDGFIFEPITTDDNETAEASTVSDTYLSQAEEENFFSFRAGIARIARNKPRIVPYKNYGNQGELISFKDAIKRLNRIQIQQR